MVKKKLDRLLHLQHLFCEFVTHSDRTKKHIRYKNPIHFPTLVILIKTDNRTGCDVNLTNDKIKPTIAI